VCLAGEVHDDVDAGREGLPRPSAQGERHDLVARVLEDGDEVRPDEAGRTGHEYATHRPNHPHVRKYTKAPWIEYHMSFRLWWDPFAK
jgi:hypothetical protein